MYRGTLAVFVLVLKHSSLQCAYINARKVTLCIPTAYILPFLSNALGKMRGAGDQTGYFLAKNQFSSPQSCRLLFDTLCLVLFSADCFLHTFDISL